MLLPYLDPLDLGLKPARNVDPECYPPATAIISGDTATRGPDTSLRRNKLLAKYDGKRPLASSRSPKRWVLWSPANPSVPAVGRERDALRRMAVLATATLSSYYSMRPTEAGGGGGSLSRLGMPVYSIEDTGACRMVTSPPAKGRDGCAEESIRRVRCVLWCSLYIVQMGTLQVHCSFDGCHLA